MKKIGNNSDGRSQGVPKISGHLCIGRMGALRGHLCDSTAFLFTYRPKLCNIWLSYCLQTYMRGSFSAQSRVCKSQRELLVYNERDNNHIRVEYRI